ncbi:AAA family ATPase [Pseudomonas sp.]|uniref:AAA family ATPase n=1 Tax=Pseudomonas sp. TaxID=306 RepID=UPI0028A9BC2F|nr:AAA family ATPase [Pseudomonas sp.]
MPYTLTIPTIDGDASLTLEEGTSTILVGANGAGKSRLAVFLEDAGGEEIHRISAHRALELKPEVPKIKESQALKRLRFGHAADDVHLGYRSGYRWGSKAASKLLNDFDFLLQCLFAEQSRTALATHKNSRAGNSLPAIATKFEQLQTIWEHLLPHRELLFSGDDIQVRVPGNNTPYSAADMSDGERAIFYLIGQVLVASDNSVLVIDEPELHIHRSVMSKLWDQLESARPDCAILFITHDLEFAASRVGLKYVIRDYRPAGPTWAIDAIPSDTGFSEEVTTLLLGSRRPILFVEGDTNSLDNAVYRCAYPKWTVMPRGSCQDVIRAVATLRSNTAFTRIHCAGIVDADGYEPTEIESLGRSGIAVLPVSEIENLFLLPDISREIAISEHLSPEETEERLSLLSGDLLALAGQPAVIEQVVRMYCLRRIDRSLKKTDLSQEPTIEAINVAYQEQTRNIDVLAIAQERRDYVAAAIHEGDLAKLLSLVDNKGMLAKAASRLKNTSRGPFEAWLTRMLLNERAPGLVRALRRVLPEIPEPD